MPTLATIDLGIWLNLRIGLYLECLGKPDRSDIQNSPCMDSADLQSVPTPCWRSLPTSYPLQ